MIKQEIPVGWIQAKCSKAKTLQFTKIPHKTIVTDWLFRNRHAEAIETTIIPEEYSNRDETIAAYYRKLNLSY